MAGQGFAAAAHGGWFLVGDVMADTNGLKTVYDSLGNESGDHLVELAARMVGGAIRTEDLVPFVG